MPQYRLFSRDRSPQEGDPVLHPSTSRTGTVKALTPDTGLPIVEWNDPRRADPLQLPYQPHNLWLILSPTP